MGLIILVPVSQMRQLRVSQAEASHTGNGCQDWALIQFGSRILGLKPAGPFILLYPSQ